MTSFLVIGDIHGCFKEAKKLIDTLHTDQQLILLGDYVDRGPDSKESLDYVKEKVAAGAVALRGNHEDMFLNFMAQPNHNASLYLPQGGYQTFLSYGYKNMEFDVLAKAFLKDYKEDYDFISNLPLYYETEQFIMVHAGVSPFVDDWHDTPAEDFMWIREWFHNSPNFTGKTVIFGHTPTSYLHPDKSHDIWFSPDRSKIGIDGGMVFGGKLHALAITEEEGISNIQNYSIDKDLTIQQNKID